MSEPSSLSVVANLLRPVSTDVSKGKGKLCLSTVYLNKLNKAFDENMPESLTSSFHITKAKASLQRDLIFLHDLVKGTVALKVSPDLIEESTVVDLRRFQNIKTLEIHKIDVRNIIGIQKLRSHIEDLSCTYNLENLGDLLDKCGGDYSHNYNWSELKRANFSHNHIQEIDSSFDSTPWLQILDLSHNYIKNFEFINNLPNLKRLNLSYNKLEKVPKFKGQICKRLQVLLLNNNFIEDISGLRTLSSLQQLDLAQNCLADHNTLMFITQMSCLLSLDLRGNPVNYHLNHRSITSNYLNRNTATLNFVLDNVPVTKLEKSLAGTVHPLSLNSLESNGSFSLQQSIDSLPDRRPVRNVTIQEGYDIEVTEQKKPESVTASPRSNNRVHLNVKDKIEEARKLYGDNWLKNMPDEFIQGFPGTSPSMATSTPAKYIWPSSLDPNLASTSGPSGNAENEAVSMSLPEIVLNNGDTTNEANDVKSGDQVDVDSNSIYPDDVPKDDSDDDISDVEEISEENLFLGGTDPESFNLFVGITESHHLSERDSDCRERARWHINVVKVCKPGNNPNEVILEFDTLRRDRMSRTYYMEDADSFIKKMFEEMVKNKVPEKKLEYKCMNCQHIFWRTKKFSAVLEEDTVACSLCHSDIVVIQSG